MVRAPVSTTLSLPSPPLMVPPDQLPIVRTSSPALRFSSAPALIPLRVNAVVASFTLRVPFKVKEPSVFVLASLISKSLEPVRVMVSPAPKLPLFMYRVSVPPILLTSIEPFTLDSVIMSAPSPVLMVPLALPVTVISSDSVPP